MQRNPEIRVYTPDDVLKTQLDFLHHGIIPPQEIGSVKGIIFQTKSPEEIDAHNTMAKEVLTKKATLRWESSTPKRTLIAVFKAVFAK